MTCPKVAQLGGGAWASIYPVFGNLGVRVSLPPGFYFFQKPNSRVLCCVGSPGHRKRESVEVSPAEAPAGVEGPRGWSFIFPEREYEKEEGECADSASYKRHA